MATDGSRDVTIGIFGGTGLYSMAGLEIEEELTIDTPFGPPSDAVRIGTVGGRRVAFLARHGRAHRLTPSEIPFRANVHAMRQLGVRWMLSASAVGSLREHLPPGHFVVPLQMFDRTKQRDEHTFFGRGIVAHVSFAHPVCSALAKALHDAAVECGAPTTLGGTYVNMEGPAFSTRAESEWHRSIGCDVIGMTNLAEAKLCREAEISYATLAMVTDYDAWSDQEVHVEQVVAQLHANAELGQRVLKRAIANVPLETTTPAHDALRNAILTPKDAWPSERIEALRPFLGKYL